MYSHRPTRSTQNVQSSSERSPHEEQEEATLTSAMSPAMSDTGARARRARRQSIDGRPDSVYEVDMHMHMHMHIRVSSVRRTSESSQFYHQEAGPAIITGEITPGHGACPRGTRWRVERESQRYFG